MAIKPQMVTQGFSLLKFFKMAFLYIFLTYILVSAIATGLKAHDINPVIDKLGQQFFNPLQNAYESGQEVQSGGGIFNSIYNYWGFYSSIYILYVWIFVVLSKLVGHSPLSNDSAKFINVALGTIFFYFIETLYVVIKLGLPPDYPLKTTWGIIKILINILG